MATLKTTYMGLELNNPLLVGASSLTADLDSLKAIESAGAGAVVFKSLFEEQIQLEELELQNELDEFKRKNGKILLHWLPASDALVKVELLKEDASVVNGLGENTLNKLKEGEIVQFVRVGFVKLEKKMKTKLKFIFCHK